MSKPKIHYIVRHAKPFLTEEGELDYKILEKRFLSPRSIEARKAAFAFYADYQAILDEAKEANGSDFSIAGLEARNNWEMENPDKVNKLTNSPYQAEVVLVIDAEELLSERELLGNEIKIHFKIFENSPFEVSELMSNLVEEYHIYHANDFDTEDEVIEVPFWDYESYYTYVNERHLWKEEFYSPEEEWATNHIILKTLFDWTPYARENWWNDFAFRKHLLDHRLEKREREKIVNHEELIKGGETETAEFKPILFGTIPGKDKYGNEKPRNMGLEVAQVICSFMNKHGGNIYIGVKDNGTIQGVDLERKNNEDDYIRAFTTMKRYFFGHEPAIVYHYVTGRFITVEGKRLFCITVKERESNPAFLYNRNASEGQRHEFYVREGTSSFLLYDAKHLVTYIEEKWWNKKYKNNEE